MKHRTDVGDTRLERNCGKRSLAAFLLLTASIGSSCSPKGQEALTSSPSPTNSPGPAPVVQLSPDRSATAVPSPLPNRKLFKTGEAVPAGYLGYKVFRSWFTDHLSGESTAKQSPAVNYLFVDLSIVNTDKKERSPAALKLVDEKGREYPLSAKASTVDQNVGQIARLGPSVSKRVSAIFEVPKGHEYRLKLQGFSAEEELLIQLSPAATTPAQ